MAKIDITGFKLSTFIKALFDNVYKKSDLAKKDEDLMRGLTANEPGIYSAITEFEIEKLLHDGIRSFERAGCVKMNLNINGNIIDTTEYDSLHDPYGSVKTSQQVFVTLQMSKYDDLTPEEIKSKAAKIGFASIKKNKNLVNSLPKETEKLLGILFDDIPERKTITDTWHRYTFHSLENLKLYKFVLEKIGLNVEIDKNGELEIFRDTQEEIGVKLVGYLKPLLEIANKPSLFGKTNTVPEAAMPQRGSMLQKGLGK